jgi:hypothetical protein
MPHALQETWAGRLYGAGEVAVCIPLNIWVFRAHADGGRLHVFSCCQTPVEPTYRFPYLQHVAVLPLPDPYSEVYDSHMAFLGTVLLLQGRCYDPWLAFDICTAQWSEVPRTSRMRKLTTCASGRAIAVQDIWSNLVHVFDVDADGLCTKVLSLFGRRSCFDTFWLSWDAQLIAVSTNIGLEIRWVADGQVVVTLRTSFLESCAPLPCGGFAVVSCTHWDKPATTLVFVCPCNNFLITERRDVLPFQRSGLVCVPQGLLAVHKCGKDTTFLQAFAVNCQVDACHAPPVARPVHVQFPGGPADPIVPDDESDAFSCPMICAVTGRAMVLQPRQHEGPVFCRGFAVLRKAWISACVRSMCVTT